MNIGGLQSTVIAPDQPNEMLVVILHGYSMTAADLAPFASSLSVTATYLFPEGFLCAQPAGRAWFPMDIAARRAARGAPRDLAERAPEGLAYARERLLAYLQACLSHFAPRRVILGGFSQGGMLCCDLLLNSEVNVHGLLLWSASRLNYREWRKGASRLRGMPVLISHGEHDPELAFTAGLALRDFLEDAGATVTWVPFAGGHEIPLVVWRSVRSFLRVIAQK
jgi:phospholipase/carboxylesterase